MQVPDFTKEQTVFCHRVVDTSPRQNQAIVTAEAGEHDGGCHKQSTDAPEHLGQDGGGNSVFACPFDTAVEDGRSIGGAVQRQHVQINEIAEYVKKNYNTSSHRQRERQVT